MTVAWASVLSSTSIAFSRCASFHLGLGNGATSFGRRVLADRAGLTRISSKSRQNRQNSKTSRRGRATRRRVDVRRLRKLGIGPPAPARRPLFTRRSRFSLLCAERAEQRLAQTGAAGRTHRELVLGEDGLVMVGQAGESFKSPKRLDAYPPVRIHFYVDDVDALHERALDSGADLADLEMAPVGDRRFT